MPKKLLHRNVYVKADANGFLVENDLKAWIRRAQDLEESIKRHCDDVVGTSVEVEQDEVCEFCGAIWTESSPYYNGGCCDRDIHDGEED